MNERNFNFNFTMLIKNPTNKNNKTHMRNLWFKCATDCRCLCRCHCWLLYADSSLLDKQTCLSGLCGWLPRWFSGSAWDLDFFPQLPSMVGFIVGYQRGHILNKCKSRRDCVTFAGAYFCCRWWVLFLFVFVFVLAHLRCVVVVVGKWYKRHNNVNKNNNNNCSGNKNVDGRRQKCALCESTHTQTHMRTCAQPNANNFNGIWTHGLISDPTTSSTYACVPGCLLLHCAHATGTNNDNQQKQKYFAANTHAHTHTCKHRLSPPYPHICLQTTRNYYIFSAWCHLLFSLLLLFLLLLYLHHTNYIFVSILFFRFFIFCLLIL